MSEPSEYDIVAQVTHGALIDSVNEMIADGWKPLGGVSAYVREDDERTLIQAMVKPEGDRE
jgi:hypothetical protein